MKRRESLTLMFAAVHRLGLAEHASLRTIGYCCFYQIPVSVRAAGASTAGRRQWQERHKRGQWNPKNQHRKSKSNFDV
jgi:hypothetical protein